MLFNNQTINILKQAFPHLNGQPQASVNLVLKFAELNECVNHLNSQNELQSCNIQETTSSQTNQTNSEELLRSIKPVCSKKEQELIDLILNFTKSKELFNAYKTVTNNQNTSNTPFDLLKNQLSKEQLETINTLNKLMNTD